MKRAANCTALLNSLGVTDPSGYIDTRTTNISGTQSGNENLKAETAKTWTAGVILQPRFIPGLTARVCRLLEQNAADVASCEIRNVVVPDAVTVEALARLQLGAQRHRCRVILLHASEELLDLVAFMGLSDVIAG